jgi:hypothetical protein
VSGARHLNCVPVDKELAWLPLADRRRRELAARNNNYTPKERRERERREKKEREKE